MKTISYTLLFCILVTIVFSQTHGVDPHWGNEIPLPKSDTTNHQRGVLFNNMVITSSGRIIILTQELDSNNNSQGTYFSYSDDNGNTWTTPTLFTPMNLTIGAYSPKLAIDRQDNIYVVWCSKGPAALFCSKLDQNLNILIDSSRIASIVKYNSLSPDITTDKNNRIHIIWHEGNIDETSTDTSEVYYAKSADGGNTWSSPVMISNADGKKSAYGRCHLELTSGDTIAIAWRDQISTNDWDVMMSVSSDAGQTWTQPFTILGGNDYDSDPDVVIDPYGRIHLFTHKYPAGNMLLGANVRYGYSDDLGNTWSVPRLKQLSEQGIRSHLVEGSRYDPQYNILWTTWKDERDFQNGNSQPDIMCAYSLDRGQTWSQPEFITDWDTFSVGYKSGTILPNGSYAVNYEVALNKKQVFFRKRTSAVKVINVHSDNNIKIYPNPVFNKLIINSSYYPDNYQAELYSIDGKKIKIFNLSGQISELDLRNVGAGTYILEIKNNKEILLQAKIIKK